jgi:hypothetical protein
MLTEATRRAGRRRADLSRASSGVVLAAAAALSCALPDAAHAASAAPSDTENTKAANTTVQTIVQSQQQSVRDFVQSFVRGIIALRTQQGGLTEEQQRRLRFSGEPERSDPYAMGQDPFAVLALGYNKAMRGKGPAAPAPAPQSYFVSTWAQGAHDHEKRTTTFAGAPSGSTTTANTVVAGVDVVKIGVAQQTDAFVIGGFGTWTTSHSASQQGVNARSVTPGGGMYASYINGGFSTDVSIVITNTSSRFFVGAVPGARDTDSLNIAFNTQYKWDIPSTKWWVEPTVGFSVTKMNNDQPNTTDGNIRRFQGGARVGTEYSYGKIRIEPTVTGLVYSDVDVETIILNGTTYTGLSDKGYLWGKGIGKLNVVWTDKFSTSVEGEARGRADVFGYGARVMARYTW